MTIPNPWGEGQNPPQEPEIGAQWGRARERAHAPAGEYATAEDFATGDNVSWGPWPAPQIAEGDEAQSTDIEVRPAPGALAKLGDASKVWLSDAKATAAEVFDGTVLKNRPASIRDRITRIQRAEWAGEFEALRKLGKVASIPPTVFYIALQAVAWLCTPLRFYVALAIAVLIIVLAI